MWKRWKIIWTVSIGGCWHDDVPYYCDTSLRVEPTVAGTLPISLHPHSVVHRFYGRTKGDPICSERIISHT